MITRFYSLTSLTALLLDADASLAEMSKKNNRIATATARIPNLDQLSLPTLSYQVKQP